MNDFLQNLLFKPSARDFFAQARARPNSCFRDLAHGYVYGRWTYFYISVGTGRHPLTRLFKSLYRLFKGLNTAKGRTSRKAAKVAFANGYHGKVMPLEHARKLVRVNRDIALGDLEQIIPYAGARDIILQDPEHIVALECPCRASRHNPCLPLDVCLVVGEPFAGFMAEHHPRRARRVSQQEAADILLAEHRRGHVHHAFFKDVMLGRFYAICNCCACCCGAMQAQRNGTPMLAPSGYVCAIDHDRCKRCGLCVKNCQFMALKLEGRSLVLDAAKCMGCGACAAACPSQAAKLVRDDAKGIPLDIRQLMHAHVPGDSRLQPAGPKKGAGP